MKTFLTPAILVLSLFIGTQSAQATGDTKTTQLATNIYTIDLLHYTSLVVIGEEEVLITDTANPYRANLLKQEIQSLTEKPVGKIVLSHEHFDHTGGTAVFPDAEIIAHENIHDYEELDPLDMVPDTIHQTFSTHMTIDMGTTQVELQHMGIADGAAVAIVHLPAENIVLSADMYVDEGLGRGVYLTDTNLLGVRKTLKTLISWQPKHAINVHSSSTDLAPLVATAKFLDDLYDLVLPEIKNTLATNPSQLVPRIIEMSENLKMPAYKDWPNYQDLPVYIRKMSFAIIHGG
ncbi:MBL fold metallo-hydrolase [Aliamphritea ceti]|uniref:MBL fold metallo-hydrolase n=1 Tax=Aliamphritea ceti TaxID=1524258 RepID=UPI0021C2C0A3|nr:MBL fold metallo-hydrolase [Aliamphritea ceti]